MNNKYVTHMDVSILGERASWNGQTSVSRLLFAVAASMAGGWSWELVEVMLPFLDEKMRVGVHPSYPDLEVMNEYLNVLRSFGTNSVEAESFLAAHAGIPDFVRFARMIGNIYREMEHGNT